MEPDTTNAQLTIRMHRILEDANTVIATVSRQNRYTMLADVLCGLHIEKISFFYNVNIRNRVTFWYLSTWQKTF